MTLVFSFLTGLSDEVRCFYCNGCLCNWDREQDPFAVHAHYFPDCAFVGQLMVQRGLKPKPSCPGKLFYSFILAELCLCMHSVHISLNQITNFSSAEYWHDGYQSDGSTASVRSITSFGSTTMESDSAYGSDWTPNIREFLDQNSICKDTEVLNYVLI